MAAHAVGLVALGVFYLVILLTGILASRKSKEVEKKCIGKKSEVAIVGGRDMIVVIGVFTMTGNIFVSSSFVI